MNKFLKMMDITFRRDPTNFRPRINKHESRKDQEQKAEGNYFLMDDAEEKKRKARAKKEAEDRLKEEEAEMQEEDQPAKTGKKSKKWFK